MTLFNIGPLEFILILVMMFILLGPEGMVKTARQIGTWIRKTIRSPMWGEIMGYSREIRELPTKIVRESGLDEDLKEIQKAATDITKEAQTSISQASQEIDQSIKETGTIEVKLDGGQTKVNTSLPATPATGNALAAVPTVETTSPEVEEPKPPILLD
jgi:sec-independent protein translocase protein TatB